MHGYEMISELSRRTGGRWSPSPGAVYPALQLLEDEGLIEGTVDGGRRRFTLTEAGTGVVAAQEAGLGGTAPWAAMAPENSPMDDGLQQAMAQVESATGQILATGTTDQKDRAGTVLAEARRALYRILAE
jgi:DNA-binding PadR family transcriptional regulator